MNLSSKPAPTSPQLLVFLASGTIHFFFAPAAHWCARITLESRINHSKSGSCNASKTRFQVPLKVQLSNRFQTEFQFPNRSGKSRQGAVRAIQSTALTNSRFSIASQPGSPGRPARKFSIRPQSASEIAWRGSIDCLSWSKRKTDLYPNLSIPARPSKTPNP